MENSSKLKDAIVPFVPLHKTQSTVLKSKMKIRKSACPKLKASSWFSFVANSEPALTCAFFLLYKWYFAAFVWCPFLDWKRVNTRRVWNSSIQNCWTGHFCEFCQLFIVLFIPWKGSAPYRFFKLCIITDSHILQTAKLQ